MDIPRDSLIEFASLHRALGHSCWLHLRDETDQDAYCFTCEIDAEGLEWIRE